MRRVVLVRAVNVGGAHRLPMADLRALLADLGCTDVQTHLASGNAVVTGGPAELGPAVGGALQARLGLDVAVLTRTAAELDDLVAGDPFVGEGLDPARHHVGFLDGDPDPERVAALDPSAWAPDRLVVVGRHAHLAYAHGAGRSRLAARPPDLGVAMTARNWRTVLALRERCAHDR